MMGAVHENTIKCNGTQLALELSMATCGCLCWRLIDVFPISFYGARGKLYMHVKPQSISHVFQVQLSSRSLYMSVENALLLCSNANVLRLNAPLVLFT
jgi:hypothetical protein